MAHRYNEYTQTTDTSRRDLTLHVAALDGTSDLDQPARTPDSFVVGWHTGTASVSVHLTRDAAEHLHRMLQVALMTCTA